MLPEHGSCLQTWVQPASREAPLSCGGQARSRPGAHRPGATDSRAGQGDLMGRLSFQLLLGEALSGAADRRLSTVSFTRVNDKGEPLRDQVT